MRKSNMYATDPRTLNPLLTKDSENLPQGMIGSFATKSNRYTIGNGTGNLGYSGHKFNLYMKDYTIQERVVDIWDNGSRVEEPITVLKMEGCYNPFLDSMGLAMASVEGRGDCEVILLPWSVKGPICSNHVQVRTKAETIELLENSVSLFPEGFDKAMLLNTIKLCNLVDAENLYLTHNDVKGDIDLLKTIMKADYTMDELDTAMDNTQWGWSMTPFSEVLTVVKELYFKSYGMADRESLLRSVVDTILSANGLSDSISN